MKLLQWRSGELDFASLARLKDSLRAKPSHGRLARGGMVDDLIALENVSRDEKTAAMATAPAAIKQLWDVCQVPDFRKISAIDHAERQISHSTSLIRCSTATGQQCKGPLL